MILEGDCYKLLGDIESNSIDLVLTDPPYNISKVSNFSKLVSSGDNNSKFNKMSIDFGEWDHVGINLDDLLTQYFRVLKSGGTLIMFYDVWKIGDIKDIGESVGFKQPRIGCWLKTNPTPINSSRNYLSNSSEYFISMVKGGKPTFNSKYDRGVYNYPLCHGYERTSHPTQKPVKLFQDLINKHSNVGDLVLDTFAGSGTTGEACLNTGRKFILIEENSDYITIIKNRLSK